MTDIRVPTLGESVTEATIGKWFKKPGDAVAVDEPLVELETDKVTIEVPAPAAGVLAGDRRQGRRDRRGRRAARRDQGRRQGAAAAATTTGAPDKKQSTTAPIKAGEEEIKPRAQDKVEAADAQARTLRPTSLPATCRSRRRCARCRRNPASRRPSVAGTGKDGRVTKGDMMAAIERAAAAPTPVRRLPPCRCARRRRPTTPRAKSA